MGRITSNIGLITGIPITDTVDQLIAVQARPRDLLLARNKQFQAERVAVQDLIARLLSLQLSAKKLGESKLYEQRSATSSNPSALSVTVTGSPPLGSYPFVPLQTAQSHQLLSGGFADANAALGVGSFSFRFGGFVDPNTELDELNGGEGISRGKIRITDRSGASAEIDLRFARTLEDVLNAISDDPTINVTAQAAGDRIRLIDETGQVVSNLRVQEVGQGTTAALLGLTGIDAATDQVAGADVVRLFDDLALQRLNSGNGVRFDDVLADLRVTFRDGSAPLDLDFNEVHTGEGLPNERLRTLGEVLAKINAADPARLNAEIGPDGDRIVLTDLTTDSGGTFAVTGVNGSKALEDLGLNTGVSGATLSGRRTLAGLGTTLLSDLGGTIGLGPLGLLSLTDRLGAQATVDLASAETLQDILDAINAAGLSITARVNQARNGIDLVDTSGATASNLIVANGDADTQTASKLQLTADQAGSTVHSGSLKRRVISENTKLSSLNGGAGVANGSLRIVDSSGAGVTLNITGKHQTIGDVIKALNNLGLNLEARINDAGDGIALVETGGGSGKIRVLKGGSTTAADLHILGESTEIDVGGTLTEVLNGSTTATVALDGAESLNDLVAKVNAGKWGVVAAVLNDGSATKPFRFSLTSQRSGEQGELSIDTTATGFSLAESAAARDARLLFGSATSTAPGVLATSPNNDFTGLLPGTTLTILSTSDTPITVTIAEDDTNLVAAVQAVVDGYNELHAKLVEYTKYDEESATAGPLQGDGSALRLQNELARLVSNRLFGAGTIESLATLGAELNQDGTLAFDSTEFQARLVEAPSAVRDFFSTEDLGFADKFDSLVQQLADGDAALLVSRELAIQRRIDQTQERINRFNARLERSQQRLLNQFYRLELAIGKIKSNQSALDSLAQLASQFQRL